MILFDMHLAASSATCETTTPSPAVSSAAALAVDSAGPRASRSVRDPRWARRRPRAIFMVRVAGPSGCRAAMPSELKPCVFDAGLFAPSRLIVKRSTGTFRRMAGLNLSVIVIV